MMPVYRCLVFIDDLENENEVFDSKFSIDV